VLCANARSDAAERHLVRRGFQAMGTEVSFAVMTDDEDGAERAIGAAFDEIKRVEDLMTTWHDSDVTRVNDNAGIAPVKVSPETLEVIEMAQKTSKMSGGVFDISFYAMHGIWKFDEDMVQKVPSAAEIKKRLPLVDYRKILVDHDKSTVFLQKKGMGINLGGIAKGYAVDRCAAVLRQEGLSDFMVQAGGDLFVSGSKGPLPWKVGIRDPRGPADQTIGYMPIRDHAFSTAGDYERSFILDGKRYHHIIDPKTGYPATASREVTIFAPTAFLADALDDAAFILGPKVGLALVDGTPDCAAVIVDAQNQVWMSKSLEGQLVRTGAPTGGL
jgi:FAD:protein FMN transferase